VKPNKDLPVSPDLREDKPEEACGVFGVYAPGEDVSRLTYFGLHALQHRGQESAGIAVGDGSSVLAIKDMGLVTQVFDENALSALTGFVAIGHTRYSATGGSGGHTAWEAAEPHLSTITDEIIALAHNGSLINSVDLRRRLVELGVTFRSSADSEVAAKLIGYFTQESHHMREGIRRSMELIEGAYAMVLITQDALYAFRDPCGIRPLVIGRLPEQRGWVVASETCGLDIVGAEYYRDVEPGEVIRIKGTGDDGLIIEQAVPQQKHALCIFEYVYFARPDSNIDGMNVYHSRDAMGRQLAIEAPADADAVIGVPDSGVPSAIGYAGQSGIPYLEGIVKNRYVGRTFIQPTQALRERGVRLKLNPLSFSIAGKRLVVVDDSIVRGTTSQQLIAMLRDAGASEIHVRIVSPPVSWPCFYGIDTNSQDELISATKSVEEICEFLGADSLAYISEEGLLSCMKGNHNSYCTSCFSGSYPVKLTEKQQQDSFRSDMVPTWWPQESQGMASLF
jgi:amidophosphoribosyltransferase